MSGAPTADARPASLPLRRVAAVVVGNALEFYDFLTYAFFAVQIGQCFFPASTPGGQLLPSLAVFGAGFLTRPLGAVVIGGLADRIGRRPAMLLSFTLMGVAIAGLVLTPPFRTIGVAAPILVIAWRLLQGFALGGEVGPTTAYLVEAAPPHRRGFYASLQYMTQDLSVLAAGLVGVGLADVLSPQALTDWGWRAAMAVGVIVVPIGVAVRRNLPETLFETGPDAAPAPGGIGPHLPAIGIGLLALAGAGIANYTLDYLTTYAATTLHMRAGLALGATVVLGVFGTLSDPVGGLLSDRFGRKRVMMIPWAMLCLAAIPTFVVITRVHSAAALYGGAALLQVLLALSAPAVLIAVTETLPRHVRAGAVALAYALALSVFGGATQFMIRWLIQLTRDPLVPAYYLTGFAVLSLIAMAALKESAPARASAKRE
ncbi:MAG: MFS transporter [Caulobacteraceae bacterium]|nr:MFS transporter [Caulobacteraceae bacterium]